MSDINTVTKISSSGAESSPAGKIIRNIIRYKYLYLMSLLGFAYLMIFYYVPMYGVIIAFKDFRFSLGIMRSPWNDFAHFKELFTSASFFNVLRNSVWLNVLKLLINFPIPIIFALMLNEISSPVFKRVSQTAMYLPHFISWVVIAGIAMNFLSTNGGIIPYLVGKLGGTPRNILGDPRWFRSIILMTSVWRGAGWGTIIYLAALSGVNPEYYDAAIIDGASRFQRIRYITLPCISNTIVILLILQIGNLMDNGFEQIYLFQNPVNLQVAEVFETYTYKVGLINSKFSFATAVGLFKSVVGMLLLIISNSIARVFGKESIF
ncbi:MAG: ABC transporter permease [Christensenellales bacterium]